LNLLLLAEEEVEASGAVRLTGPRAEHVLGVLRSGPGDHLRIGVLDGPLGVGTVTAVREGAVDLQCRFDLPAPSQPRVDLLMALPRPKVMRRLWAQLAAIGVRRIVLTNAARVERHYFDTHILTEAAYRPLLIEGLQQARDTRVPLVSVRRQFKILVEDELDTLCEGGLRIVAHPGARASMFDIVRGQSPARVLLAIGPEGGWTEFELDLLAAHGFKLAGAGSRALRSDTACITLLALVHEALVSA
jgi:16S rRNA (uracil1498-N3)-methyltransferase